MTCDLCKVPIGKGEAYAVTEFGRTHHQCLRMAAIPSQFVLGRLVPVPGTVKLERADPIYVLRRV